jgi:hypothetical protein
MPKLVRQIDNGLVEATRRNWRIGFKKPHTSHVAHVALEQVTGVLTKAHAPDEFALWLWCKANDAFAQEPTDKHNGYTLLRGIDLLPR